MNRTAKYKDRNISFIGYFQLLFIPRYCNGIQTNIKMACSRGYLDGNDKQIIACLSQFYQLKSELLKHLVLSNRIQPKVSLFFCQ